jgi:hypothetical protein
MQNRIYADAAAKAKELLKRPQHPRCFIVDAHAVRHECRGRLLTGSPGASRSSATGSGHLLMTVGKLAAHVFCLHPSLSVGRVE